MKDQLKLSLPRSAEYVTIARLTASSVAARVGFDLEVIEDIKLSVSEVCNLALLSGGNGNYELEYTVGGDYVEISAVIESETGEIPSASDFCSGGAGLGLVIIKTLMDQVETRSVDARSYRLTMRKNLVQ